MISHYTWPNFRNGGDKEGTRVIVEEQGFEEDVQYGKTKLFIKSPQTVFKLEDTRTKVLPGIIIFLQKVRAGSSSLLYDINIRNTEEAG